MFRRTPWRWIAPPAAALAAALVWDAAPSGLPEADAQPIPEHPASLIAALPFLGSTPTLAWSPDGRRLAFNAAYEYYGYDPSDAEVAERLGVWVHDFDAGTTRRLVSEQRYHPAWIGDDTIASACSPYETCTEGLFLTDLDGNSTHALDVSVYHTLAGSDGGVVFFNGFSGYTQWNHYDPGTGARRESIGATCSWEPPPGLAQDQCVQTVGDTRVWAQDSGLWATYGASAPVQIDESPGYYFTSQAWDCRGDHSGYVQPCLSPDGQRVAHVTGDPSALLLRVHSLPAPDLSAEPAPLDPALLGAALPGHAAPTAPVDETALFSTSPLSPRMTPPTSDAPSRPYLGIDFYGETSTVSWSPDGRYLAFNAAYHGARDRSDWDPSYATVRGALGVFVVEPTTASLTQVSDRGRLHPTWSSPTTLVTACDDFADCAVGMLAHDVVAAARSVVSTEPASNVAPGPAGTMFSFEPIRYQWMRHDAEGTVTAAGSTTCSWEPPAEAGSQCLSEVGDTRVSVREGMGLYYQRGAAPEVRLDPTPPAVYGEWAPWGCSRTDHGGLYRACLSPDGRYASYIARGTANNLSLHVHELP